MRELRYLIAALLLTALSNVGAAEAPWRFDGVTRVVAIADVHGDFAAMTETLQRAEIIDADRKWRGGESHLVVVGDLLDRGPNSRKAMDLLMRLEVEAIAGGGRVHVLMGNHESMLLTGDMRYVSDAEYAAFAADENAEERDRWLTLFAERQGIATSSAAEIFDTRYPPGYFAMRRAFRPDGVYGAWLLQKNIIVVINETAFVHGGLSPLVTEVGLSGVNDDLRAELQSYTEALAAVTEAELLLPTDSHYDYADLLKNSVLGLSADATLSVDVKTAVRLTDSPLLGTEGPLWYRANVMCPGIVEEYRLDNALEAIDAKRVVVGHTPTPNRAVLQRFNGKLIEIDTGMLGAYYRGSGNALVIEGDNLFVTNQHSIDDRSPLPHPRNVGRRAPELGVDALAELLSDGVLNEADVLHDGSRLFNVSNADGDVSAVYLSDELLAVAAYRLDRLLNLDMVPVTVARTIDEETGSLQFLPAKTRNELQRSADGSGGGAGCPLPDQWSAMYLFDVLIYNVSRRPTQMLYDTSSWRLMLSGNDDTFSTRKGRPRHLRAADLSVSDGWLTALKALDDTTIEREFADLLNKKQRRALRARRDELIRATNH